MTDASIECPHCHRSFKLTETLAAPLVDETRRRLERDFGAKEVALQAERKAVADQREAAEKARKEIESQRAALATERQALGDQVAQQVAQTVAEKKAAIEQEAARQAGAKYAELLAERDAQNGHLEATMKDQARKLAEAQQAQTDAIRKQRELDEKMRELDLAAEKKAAELIAPQLERARKDAERERADFAKEREVLEGRAAEKMAEQRAGIEREAASRASAKYDEQLAERDAQKAQLEEAMREQARKLAEAQQARATHEEQLAERDAQKGQLEAAMREQAGKLAEAQRAQTDAMRKQRELDEKLREADLVAEKKAAELVAPQLEKAKRDADEAARLRLAEKDRMIEVQKQQLAEAQRKLEQGSQQMQGEILEIDLEKRLADAFRRDSFEEVGKGQRGADVLHCVLGDVGQRCGSILWESKRTKNWDGKWPDKLKQDQRAAKADLAVIVTLAMPAGLDTFGEVEGVWVTTPALAIALAAALRLALTEASLARRATEGQQDKMAILYQYLTGPQFRQRVEAIKEAFTAMQADLSTERTVYERQWAKRQKQIDRVMASTVGMWGELQAIAGTSLQQIDGLEMRALGSGGDATNA